MKVFLNKETYYLLIEPLLIEMNDCAIFTDFIHLKVGESANGQIQSMLFKFGLRGQIYSPCTKLTRPCCFNRSGPLCNTNCFNVCSACARCVIVIIRHGQMKIEYNSVAVSFCEATGDHTQGYSIATRDAERSLFFRQKYYLILIEKAVGYFPPPRTPNWQAVKTRWVAFNCRVAWVGFPVS